MAFLIAALAAAAAAQSANPNWTPLQQARPAAVQPTQAAIAPGPTQAVILAPASGSVLRAGTEIQLRMEEGLDSNDKTVREGNHFRMEIAEPVMLGGLVVIPAGSPATGEIVDIRRKGMWGKSGRITARVLNLRVGDRLIRLTGSFDDKGTTGTAGVVASVAFVPIAGFFVTGTSAKIPAGAGVKAFLDEDVAIAVPQAAPTPVQAGAPH
jgi:hypothetical protein